MTRGRTFAVLPAAGISQRMGRNKLLLPWGNGTVVEQVLATWSATAADEIVLVLGPESHAAIDYCRSSRATWVTAAATPPDMRASVQLGLERIRREFAPTEVDAWLLAPADLPLLRSSTIERVVEAEATARARLPREAVICVATHGQRRGHPVCFPWSLADEVFRLPDGQGINALVRRYAVHEIEVDDPGITLDLDTPEDYERLCPPAQNRDSSG